MIKCMTSSVKEKFRKLRMSTIRSSDLVWHSVWQREGMVQGQGKIPRGSDA